MIGTTGDLNANCAYTTHSNADLTCPKNDEHSIHIFQD